MQFLIQNIGLIKTVIEEEWNKMSEEFILKACKSFRRCVDNTSLNKSLAWLIKQHFLGKIRLYSST